MKANVSNEWSNTSTRPLSIHGVPIETLLYPFKHEAQTALFKDPVRTAQ